MTKFDKWIERITNQPNYEIMENELTSVIESVPDKYYLAIYIKPYLTHVNNSSFNLLYRYLASPENCAVHFPSTIQRIIVDCRSNERVLELVKQMIRTFHY
jgi:hypothetical protein